MLTLRLGRFARPAASGWLRLLTICVAGLALFAQLSSALHFAVESHEICAEHGDWVHADSGVALGGAHGVSNAEALDAISPAAGSEDHGHDHCTAVSSRELEARAPLTEVAVSLASYATDSLHGPWVDAPSPAGIYAFAPKTSPPVGCVRRAA